MISSTKFERMFTHLTLASKKAEEKQLAREKVKKQIGKIRKASLETYPPKKKVVDREITKLEKNIADMLEKENTIIKTQKKDEESINELQDKTGAINEKLEKLNEMLLSLNAQSEKIPEPQLPQEHLSTLQHNLSLLEQKHEVLKRSGQHNPEVLTRIEQRINSLKQKLGLLI